MKKYLAIISIILVLTIILISSYQSIRKPKKEIEDQENTKIKENIINQNQTETDIIKDSEAELVEVKNLKKEMGFSGGDDLYFLAKEYDGRKVLAIKPEKSFQVALAAVLNQGKPTFSELTTLLEKQPKKTGIWIEPNSQKKWMEMIKQVVGDLYTINEEGYLIRKEGQKKEGKYTVKIDQMIQGEKTYIVTFQPTSFVIDIVSGEITENFFEQMDPYQIYEYFENEGKQIFIITTNQEKKLTNEEIIESILEKV